MKKEKKYIHKMIVEFTNPKKNKLFMRATVSAENKEIKYEGEMKRVSVGLKPELPKNYHTDWREDTGKYWWYYIGRNDGKKDFKSPKYFAFHEDAVRDAIKHYNNAKTK